MQQEKKIPGPVLDQVEKERERETRQSKNILQAKRIKRYEKERRRERGRKRENQSVESENVRDIGY